MTQTEDNAKNTPFQPWKCVAAEFGEGDNAGLIAFWVRMPEPRIWAGDATLLDAALDLYEALKAMQAACDEWAAEFTQHKRAMNWGIVNDAYVKAARALAKVVRP